MEATRGHDAAATAGAAKVWDLADASHGPAVRRRGLDAGGPVAAALGGVALGGAVAPGLPMEARWVLVIGAGALGLIVACSAIRRRQALLSLLLAFAGLIAPLAAGAVAMDASMAVKPAVSSTIVPDRDLAVPAATLVPTAAFTALASSQRADAAAFATALVLRLRTLHGPFGPYPATLQLSDGSVVEGAGPLQGTALGAVPRDSRLEYAVTSDGTAFRLVVVALHHDDATLTAGSALAVTGSD